MSDPDLFKDKDDTTDQDSGQQNKDENKQETNYDQMLGLIVNSDGKQKYNSVEDVIKGTLNAQAHIETLEKELSKIRESQNDDNKMEEIIAAIKQSQESSQKEPTDGGDKISATDIQAIVNNTLKDINSKTVQEKNVTTVTNKFKELYGDKASETLYGKAEDLGFDQKSINSLIAQNPKAVFRMLGVDDKPNQSSNMDNTSINTDNFQHKEESKIPSSMGYLSTKQLETNWLESKKRTLARLEAS